MKGHMKELLWLDSTFKASCFIAILFAKTVWIDKAKILSTNIANERPHEGTLSALIQASKLAVILKFYSQKTSLICRGRNSFYKQSKWKASWRNSLCLDSTFKTSCYIVTLFNDWSFWKGIIIFVAFLLLTIGGCWNKLNCIQHGIALTGLMALIAVSWKE